MTSYRLDSLPEDVQGLIYSYSSIDDLHALAKVNRCCRDISTPFRYRGVTIHISTHKNLCNGISLLKGTSKGKLFLKYARYLELDGPMARLSDEKAEEAFLKPEQIISHVGSSFTLLDELSLEYHYMYDVDDTVENVSKAWEPLILNLGQFKHLSDIIHQCGGRFPYGLHSAISEFHPACRLHLRYFEFKSLNDDETDAAEHELVTSLHLHSLSLRHGQEHYSDDNNDSENYNREAAFSIIELVPNLKHIRMLLYRPLASILAPQFFSNQLLKPWKGFQPAIKPVKRGSLVSFSLAGERLSMSLCDQLNRQTDISKLKQIAFSVEDPNVLLYIATFDWFSLEELSIAIEYWTHNERARLHDEFLDAREPFFQSLPPLRALTISGDVGPEFLGSISQHFGSSLQSLSFTQSDHGAAINASQILSMAHNCSSLSQLEITICRTKSDRRETKCYEALGKIQCLRRLKLHLTFGTLSSNNSSNSSSSSSDPLEDYDNYVDNYSLINAAVDESLARSIWDILLESGNSTGLESLEIIPNPGAAFGMFMSEIRRNLSRSYRITRHSESGNGDDKDSSQLVVTELTKDQREQFDKRWSFKQVETEVTEDGKKVIKSDLFRVFDRLWPFFDEDKDWRTAWKSRPLQR